MCGKTWHGCNGCRNVNGYCLTGAKTPGKPCTQKNCKGSGTCGTCSPYYPGYIEKPEAIHCNCCTCKWCKYEKAIVLPMTDNNGKLPIPVSGEKAQNGDVVAADPVPCEAKYMSEPNGDFDDVDLFSENFDDNYNVEDDAEMAQPAVKMSQVASRPGQAKCRAAVLAEFNSKCVVTKCDCVCVLEAAHIVPFAEDDNSDGTVNPKNGIVLRADVHKLFDDQLLRVCEKGGSLYWVVDKRASYLADIGNMCCDDVFCDDVRRTFLQQSGRISSVTKAMGAMKL